MVAVAGAAYAGFAAARLAAFDGDPSAFLVPGDGVLDPASAPDNLGVNHGIDGYDGQAYYRLARDPLTRELTDHGITWTRPAYWQTRIGYPLASWLLSLGGREALVPTAMVVVNLLALVAVAGLAARLAREVCGSPWPALVVVLWAGWVIGLAEDLTEPLAGAFLVAALLALRRRRWGWAALALTAAALTRETSLVLAVAVSVVAAVGAVAALLRRSGRSYPPRRGLFPAEAGEIPPLRVGAAPLVAYAAWRLVVRARWADVAPDAPGDNILGWPFVGLLRYLGTALSSPVEHAGNLLPLALTLAALGLVVSGLASAYLTFRHATRPDPVPEGQVRDGARPHEWLALAAYLAVLVCLPVWDRGQAYLRWCCEPVLLGWLLLLAHPRRLRAMALVVTALWLVSAVATYDYPGTAGWVPATAR